MKNLSIIATIALTIVPLQSIARDFAITRECSIAIKGRVPLHTVCKIKGGMQGGGLDVSVRTADGHSYSLDGPIDREGGSKFMLQNHAAIKTSADGSSTTCYARIDGMLEICATTN